MRILPKHSWPVLHARALDAKTTTPILDDQHAVRLVEQLDYDFSKLRVHSLKAAAQNDGAPVTILHLAAGLDTRALRLQGHCSKDGANTRWIDVDLPDVIDVRRGLHLPEPDSDRMQYEMVGADVTDELWLAKLGVPRDRRTLVVFEGLTMYLKSAQGRMLIEQLTSYFVKARNQMVFDCFNWFPMIVQRLEPIIARTGSTISWAINDPKDLEGWHQGLHLTGEILPADNPENVRLPIVVRCFCWIVSWIPTFRTSARNLRYEW
ncbi:hypothetical protein INS49_009641 [Diaporthe citri]|uniref:uncharacterized protein n=1 Tax=Diaporthe citri TaxID=83186 RepID=UPI001C826520|nr:uncharacterized protein INS49_009641 [Diaporthe citri]KAG6361414.1 hypothetical protein INS49_009641 [Diaporthe citri]